MVAVHAIAIMSGMLNIVVAVCTVVFTTPVYTYCNGFNHICCFNHICYHILCTTAVCVVATARNMIAVALLNAITASVITDIVLSHM